ncbi:MAG: type II secretion system protein GspG [Deltaproteobacteria bacterium]|nr:type II secretion system protein GspG [Deltaproteobacteria bacterium]
MSSRSRRRPRATTLMEIMVVITLIGLITAAVGAIVFDVMRDGQDQIARNQAYDIEKSMEIYRLQHGSYPALNDGITALTAPPRGRPILKAVPQDPWGAAFGYASPGVENPSAIDIRSSGRDRVAITVDDVGNWPAREAGR